MPRARRRTEEDGTTTTTCSGLFEYWPFGAQAGLLELLSGGAAYPILTGLGSRSWTCRKLVALTCGFAAGERRSCALIPGLRAGVPYLRTGLDGSGPAGKSVSQRAAGSAR